MLAHLAQPRSVSGRQLARLPTESRPSGRRCVGSTRCVGLMGQLSQLDQIDQMARESPPYCWIRRPPTQRQTRLTQSEIEMLIEDYRAGSTINALAEQYHIHRTTVMNHLRRNKVKTRRFHRGLNGGQVRRAAERYTFGMSLAQLGEEFGVDAEVIRREFIKLGLPRRLPGRPQEG